jgi:hypothetical protein
VGRNPPTRPTRVGSDVGGTVFSFVQVEFPWQLGPPDGRYLLRPPGDTDGAPSHVVVLATLGAPERRRLTSLRRARVVDPRPEPTPVTTGRATVIDVAHPLSGEPAARTWLSAADENDLLAGLAVLNRTLHAFRLVTADPYLPPVSPRHALVARLGFGAGEEVADGLWTAAREMTPRTGPRRRRAGRSLLEPQARLAAVLSAREAPLVSEELTLRARLDLDHGRTREAALQLLVALDAALAELAAGPPAGKHTAELAERLAELRGQREAVGAAAQAALTGPLHPGQLESVSLTLARVEAALRARAAAGV